MIPTGYLQDLLARVDIVELISRSVQLRKGGANYLGLCPFHGEKSPSFTVSPAKQFYHCFGCGAHGDAVRFLVEHHGMGFIDAVRDLSQQTGLRMPESRETPEQRAEALRKRERQVTLTDVLAKAAQHYRGQLRSHDRAVDYLKARGLTGEVAARFGIGYAPDAWKGLASAFPDYSEPLLEEAGLVIVQGEPPEEQRRYDRFRDRVMFPIRSVQGDVIGFGGRVLDRGEPKYLNSPETPVFSKGRELYGLYEARTEIRRTGYALVVEGYMDVVALAQMGLGHAVATLGTACTTEHLQKLFRFTDSVVFSFDGDAAGRRAALRAMEAALPHATDTRTVRFLYLPAEHDPDTYVREHGAPAFEAAVSAAVPLSQQLADAAAQGEPLDSAEARAQMLARAKPWVLALPDGLLRRQIVDRFAALGQIDRATLEDSWAPAGRYTPWTPRNADGQRDSRDSRDVRSKPRSGRPPLAPLATPLDRAAWLLMRRCDGWQGLSHDDHDLFTQQPAPYSAFFGWLDRVLNDLGPMTLDALVEAARNDTEADTLMPLIERWQGFLDLQLDDSDAELQPIIDTLRLQAIDAELELLFGTPGLPPEAMAHSRELMRRRAVLKSPKPAA